MPPGVPCPSWWGSRPPAEALWPDPTLGEGQALLLLPLAIWVQEGSGGHCSPPSQCAPTVPRPCLATSLPSWIFA